MLHLFMCLFFSLFTASEAVVTQPRIETIKTLNSKDLNFIFELFDRGRMMENMECKIESRFSKELHKFKDKNQWIEKVEIKFRPDIYTELETENLVISIGDIYGHRILSQAQTGPVEEFRIEFKDIYSSYIKFSHDGLGRVTGFVYGNIYVIHPCSIKKH